MNLMNRRGFLSLFGTAAAVVAVDPERLLWEAGKKVISISQMVVLPPPILEIGDVFTMAGIYAVNPMTRQRAVCFDPATGRMTAILQRFVASRKDENIIEAWPPCIPNGLYQNADIEGDSYRGNIVISRDMDNALKGRRIKRAGLGMSQ